MITMVDVSRVTFRRIWMNFGWAFLYNVMAIPLATGLLYPVWGILIPPVIAGAAELLSSLPVVISSVLITLYKRPKPQTLLPSEVLE